MKHAHVEIVQGRVLRHFMMTAGLELATAISRYDDREVVVGVTVGIG